MFGEFKINPFWKSPFTDYEQMERDDEAKHNGYRSHGAAAFKKKRKREKIANKSRRINRAS